MDAKNLMYAILEYLDVQDREKILDGVDEDYLKRKIVEFTVCNDDFLRVLEYMRS